MKFGSVCSGIEAASVALKPLGWQAEFVSEIDPFCCAVLNHHYPTVPNYGDITKIEKPSAIAVLVGGTPCQSFSITGLRDGMAATSGQLALAFCRVALASHARWVVWENVPGALSSNDGRDFGSIVAALVQLGYGVAWRVLDASGFGVPQRRRRLFLVGHLGDNCRAGAVLFDSPARRQNARPTKAESPETKPLFRTSRDTRFGWTGDETPKHVDDGLPTLRAYQGGEGIGVISETEFRRLTISEYERAQGFPSGYTNIEGASDRQRRQSVGNAFCVQVIRWIGSRIQEVERNG